MLTLCNELRQSGHTVDFGTFRGRGFTEDVRRLGYSAETFPFRLKIDPVGIFKLARYLKVNRYDLVHGHLSSSALNAGLAAKLARVPSLATVHGLSSKYSFTTCNHLIAVSAEVRRHLESQGVNAAKISVVHNGIVLGEPPSPALRQAARTALNLPPEVLVLGTTARLTPLKGVNIALHAMKQIHDDYPGAIFVVFGDGPAREQLGELAESLGIAESVRWMGYRNDVRDLLPALDVFLFPSLKEAMGIAIIEAMAAGVAVIANEVGGIPEVVPEGSGILVAPGDFVSLATAGTNLLRETESRNRIATAGLELVRKEFTAERMAAKTVGVYRATMARFQGDHPAIG